MAAINNSKIISREIVCLNLKGNDVLIEYKDLKHFGEFKFFIVKKAGSKTKYVAANLKRADGSKRTIYLHQLIMNAPKGYEVDHINNNGLDNRKSNLRVVTHMTNQNNLPLKDNKKFRGIYFCNTRSAWTAQVVFNKKRKSLGSYNTPEEAAIAWNNEVIRMGLTDKKRLNVL